MDKFNFENTRLLDIVDENDQIIDSRTRIDIHRLGLLHREIHLYMFDENKNIIFQKRGLERHLAGLFSATVGGHLNKGEDYLNAAIRETKEETGISISPYDIILLKKIKEISAPRENYLGTINNFIRNVYVYKKPIEEEQIAREKGVIGVDFKSFSKNSLQNLNNEYKAMFDEFILINEVPEVLQYLNNL